MDNILKYENLVNKIAHKYSNYSNFEDLKQAGMLGLIMALDKYVVNSNTKFSTYAYLWIKGSILEYLNSDKGIKLSKDLIGLNKEITICQDILRNRLNKEPSIKEIAFYLEKDEKLIEDALISKEKILSFDTCLNNDDDNKDVCLYDSIPYYEKQYDYIDLYSALDMLNDEERGIIEQRYFKDLTQTEVSKILGTNQVNISRKEEKILKKLSKKLVA